MRFLLTLLVLGASLGSSAQFYGYNDVAPPGQTRVAQRSAGNEVRIDQRLDESIPLDASFKDSRGDKVTIGDCLDGKAAVILPIFYKCPGVCETEFNALTESLRGFKRDFVGKDFEVIVLGIDPGEGPRLAATKKDEIIASYMGNDTHRDRRLMAEAGWHFLTGDMKQIRRVTDALGFRYTYDGKSGNIVHPAGIMVVSPTGKICRYFLSTEYPQQILLNSIRDANKDVVGVRDDRPFFLACVQINPLTGTMTLNILNTLKTMGVVTILAILGSIMVWNRKYKAANGAVE